MKMLNGYHMAVTCITVCGLIGCYIVMNYQSTALQKLLKWSKRKVVIMVMDVFQLYDVHRDSCLINNEFIAETRNAQDECSMCENMDRLVGYNLTTDESVMDKPTLDGVTNSIHNELPLVVHNNSHKAGALGVPISDIAYQVGDLPSTFIYQQCQYQSNLRARYAELPHLLNYIATDGLLPFYVFWENCAGRAIKEFRVFFDRPSYLGGYVQLMGSNWMFLCRDYTGKVYRQIELFSPFVMVMVQSGEMRIRLEAARDCVGICVDLERTLYRGDTLIFSANIYRLYYKPVCNDQDTVVIGVSGYIN